MTTDAVGGVWTYSLDLAKALEPHGVQVVLATMGPLPDDSRLAEAARVPNVSLRTSDYRLEWMSDPWADVEAAGRWLLDVEQREQPELVHLNGYAHGSLRWSAPRVVAGHSCVLSWWQAVRGETAPRSWDRYRTEVRLGLHHAHLVIAPTRAMLGCLVRHYELIGPTRVVPNGRDRSAFRPGDKQQFVMSAGRVWDQAKNVGALAKVAGELPWPVYVAGDATSPDGSSFPDSENLHLLGRISENEMRGWMGRASIYALPARYEPFGLSALEAALSGCALVLGDIESLREVWGDAALFVDPDDAEQLGEAIVGLASDAGKRDEMARRALDRAELYTLENMAREYLDAVGELLPDGQMSEAVRTEVRA